MDETEIKKSAFRKFFKANPLLFYPIVIIFSITIADIFFVEDPLLHELLRIPTWIAIGLQWIGITRGHEEQKIERLKLDRDLLKTYAKILQITGESSIRFLVPYHEKFISRIWNKLRGKTTLSLYERAGSEFSSFTKLYAAKKEMFDMQLRGYINTSDRELALKGIQCMAKAKKLGIEL